MVTFTVMKLNHVNLAVPDPHAARRFFETYFDLVCVEGTSDDDTFLAMHDGQGFMLSLMKCKPGATYPQTFHIGFLGQGIAHITQLYERLLKDGFDIYPPGHYRKDELYINTPFGVVVQVS
jgi:lactoylglutathione lyase